VNFIKCILDREPNKDRDSKKRSWGRRGGSGQGASKNTKPEIKGGALAARPNSDSCRPGYVKQKRGPTKTILHYQNREDVSGGKQAREGCRPFEIQRG